MRESTLWHAPDDWGEDRCPLIDGWYVLIGDEYTGPFVSKDEAMHPLCVDPLDAALAALEADNVPGLPTP